MAAMFRFQIKSLLNAQICGKLQTILNSHETVDAHDTNNSIILTHQHTKIDTRKDSPMAHHYFVRMMTD